MRTCEIKRPHVEYVVEKIQSVEMNPSFDNFKSLLEQIYEQDMDESRYIFLMCYCRAKFELVYSENILYNQPRYAIMKAMGENDWSTFLEAYRNNGYTYFHSL